MLRFALIFVGTVLVIGVLYRIVIAALGMTVTSWWRLPKRNAEVGGVVTSMHLLGLAFDIVPVTQNNMASLRAMGLSVLDEGDHIHAQFLF